MRHVSTPLRYVAVWVRAWGSVGECGGANLWATLGVCAGWMATAPHNDTSYTLTHYDDHGPLPPQLPPPFMSSPHESRVHCPVQAMGGKRPCKRASPLPSLGSSLSTDFLFSCSLENSVSIGVKFVVLSTSVLLPLIYHFLNLIHLSSTVQTAFSLLSLH